MLFFSDRPYCGSCRSLLHLNANAQEAARNGDIETVQILLDHGADVNSRTKGRSAGAAGGSVLHIALTYWDEDHEMISLLLSRGAKKLAPGNRVHDEL
jgi:ankyrin repeat protein